ncbi:MAG: alpha/beta fold hydrolase, partial [Caldilineaceae bacterium]|nr:alpha/beta fold hydrolase [Caldilineaceae bacterium]
RENDPAAMYNDFVAVESYDVRDRITTLEVPSLILCGRNDRMTPPALSIALHESIEGSRLHIVEGASHNVMLEKPDEVAEQIGCFIETLTDLFVAG